MSGHERLVSSNRHKAAKLEVDFIVVFPKWTIIIHPLGMNTLFVSRVMQFMCDLC